MGEVAVCDASPIVALHRIGRLALLAVAADEILVPETVVAELDARVPADGASAALRGLASVRITAGGSVSGELLARGLGRGETEVLSLAASLPGGKAILDDLAARRCAAELGVPLIGTVGIVALARRRGIVPAARPVLAALAEAGLRVSPALIRSVLAELGEP